MSVILTIVVFGTLNPKFLSIETAVTILENAAPDGLIVIGMTIVIVCGAFDMSVGSAMALCGLVAALAMNGRICRFRLAVLAALVSGSVDWLDQRRHCYPAENQSFHHHARHDEHSARDRAGGHPELSPTGFPKVF